MFSEKYDKAASFVAGFIVKLSGQVREGGKVIFLPSSLMREFEEMFKTNNGEMNALDLRAELFIFSYYCNTFERFKGVWRELIEKRHPNSKSFSQMNFFVTLYLSGEDKSHIYNIVNGIENHMHDFDRCEESETVDALKNAINKKPKED